jgi:membrane protein YdbS with pleckstrin-like domain
VHPSPQMRQMETAERVLFVVRPSFLFVGVKYLTAAVLWLLSAALVASIAAYAGIPTIPGAAAVVAVGALLFAGPVVSHVKRQRWVFTLTNYKLEIREGLLATTTRSVPLTKIQDVTLKGSLVKRVLGIGDIVVETAAESGPILMANIPDAKGHADALMRQLHDWNRSDRSGV